MESEDGDSKQSAVHPANVEVAGEGFTPSRKFLSEMRGKDHDTALHGN